MKNGIRCKNYLLGMDLGTTNIKAIIMDEKGNVAASASAANHLIFRYKYGRTGCR